MALDVHEQLDRLAQRASTGGPPPDLWRRGVRLRRRRAVAATAGALTVAVVVALGAGTAGLAWNRLDSTQPAGSSAAPAMPTRIEPPGTWTSGTDRAGPPGRLAVVAGAPRRTGVLGTERDGLVGISADTGRYRFLDLPGALADSSGMISSDTPVTLSPTGRYVAYWLGGRPAVGARFGEVAVGAAVYDTVTGHTQRSTIASAEGLSPQHLDWVDDDTVALAYSTITQRDADSMSATEAPVRLWSVRTGELGTVPGRRGLSSSDDLALTPAGFSSWDGSRLLLENRDGASYDQRVLRVRGLGRVGGLGNHLVAPDGGRVAIVSTPGAEDRGRLYVGAVPAGGTRLDVHRVVVSGAGRGVGVGSVVGWRDATHVLVEAWRSNRLAVYSVDVGTGAAVRSVTVSGQSYTPARVYATALWRTAPVDRPGPARAYDPRLLAAGGGLLALLVIGGVRAVRRRRALL